MIESIFWRLADPLLLRFRSRLEHLERRFPSRRHEDELRLTGLIASTAMLASTAQLQNMAERDHLRIGEYSHIRGEVRVMTPKANISIGDHCYVGPQTRVWSSSTIAIGRYVLIAHLVDVIDNNSHSLKAHERRTEANSIFERGVEIDFSTVVSAPVVIEDDVWIGAKSTVLKGVRIGRGAVIAAGTMVTGDVEPFTLVAGNPARVIRSLPVEP